MNDRGAEEVRLKMRLERNWAGASVEGAATAKFVMAGGRSLMLDMELDRIGLKHWHSLGQGSGKGEEVFYGASL